MSETGASGERHIAYLCLQATREGQGSHTHVLEIVEGLRRLGWGCVLYQPHYADRPRSPWMGARMLEFVRAQRRLVRGMSEFDALYVRDHPAALPAITSAHRRGLPVVLEINSSWDELPLAYPWTRPLLPLLKRWFFRRIARSDELVVVSEQTTAFLRASGVRKPITVIPNAADPRRFGGAPVEGFRRPTVRPYAVFVGTLARWQGIDTLLSAAVDKSWPADVDLVVAGDGFERGLVEKAQAVATNLVYLGSVPRVEVPALLAGAVCSLLPMRDLEGRAAGMSPIKLYESMASGVPVVVTDLQGQAEVVRDHGCGLIVPPDDPAALAEAVAGIVSIGDGAADMGRRGREAVLERHSWSHRALKTAAVLERAIGSSTR